MKIKYKYHLTLFGEFVSEHDTFKEAYTHYCSEVTRYLIRRKMTESLYFRTGDKQLIDKMELFDKRSKGYRVKRYEV